MQTTRKVIYIAGPYRDSRGEYYVRQNIRAAEEAALFVWRHGGVALCPHKNTAGMGGACPDNVWLQGDLELLSRCDAILMLPYWRGSEGAEREYDFATHHNIRILYDLEEVVYYLEADNDR